MEYKMRQAQREVKECGEIAKILDRCPTLRIAFVDERCPYVVPVNFGYTLANGKFTLYAHSAKVGRKIDLAQNCETVGFELDRQIELGKNETMPCRWTSFFESVIGEAKISFARDTEKKTGMDVIMRHNGYEGSLDYDTTSFDHMTVLKLEVLVITAKRHLPG